MKKILFLMMGMFLFAFTTDEFLDYTNKLVTYNFKLNNIDKIKSPFYEVKKPNFLNNRRINKNIKKLIHISLISIFNNTAYIKIDEFKGDELVKEYKKWIKKGDKIEQCIVINIKIDKLILKCNNKILIKSLNKKSLNIRIEK
jgi:hypothetical protein